MVNSRHFCQSNNAPTSRIRAAEPTSLSVSLFSLLSHEKVARLDANYNHPLPYGGGYATRLLNLSLAILLTGCVVVDPNDERSVQRAAESECLQLARNRVTGICRLIRSTVKLEATSGCSDFRARRRSKSYDALFYDARSNRARIDPNDTGRRDPNDERSVQRAAESECLQLARNRGYRDLSIDSVNREARRDEGGSDFRARRRSKSYDALFL